MIHLSENLKLVEVPGEATNVQVQKSLAWYVTYELDGFTYVACHFDYEVKKVGIADADTIDFDCEPYVDKAKHYTWGGYGYAKIEDVFVNYEHINVAIYRTAEKSFRSLLNSKGARFVNPYPKPMPPFQDSIMEEGLHERYKEKLSQWQAAEQSLIKGKGVVLKRIK